MSRKSYDRSTPHSCHLAHRTSPNWTAASWQPAQSSLAASTYGCRCTPALRMRMTSSDWGCVKTL